MSDDRRIFADSSLPATLNNGERATHCYTLQEAVLEWMRLPERERTAATIRADDGTVYNAQQIDRLFHKVTVKEGLFSNAAAVVSESLNYPRSGTLVFTTTERPPDYPKLERPRAESPPPPPEQFVPKFISPTFKLVFLSVLGLTILGGVAEVIMAACWTAPTPNQQSAFEAAAFVWKAGVGAVLGLVGGKVT